MALPFIDSKPSQRTQDIELIGFPLLRELRKKGLGDIILFARVVKYWNVVVGKNLALHSHPKKINNSTLHIITTDAAYTESMRIREGDIIAILERVTQSKQIRFLEFQVNYFHTPFFTRSITQNFKQNENAITQEIAPEQKEAMNNLVAKHSLVISNAKLKKYFGDYMFQCLQNQIHRQNTDSVTA